jgi:hypothetical protein
MRLAKWSVCCGRFLLTFGRVHPRDIEEEPRTTGGVSLHEEPLLRCERAIMVQDLFGDLLLPEVVAESGHGDRADHLVGNLERLRQGRRKNANIESVSKGVVVEILHLTDGLKKVPANGQTGHNRAHDLAGPNETFRFFGFEIGKDLLSLGKKPHISCNCLG